MSMDQSRIQNKRRKGLLFNLADSNARIGMASALSDPSDDPDPDTGQQRRHQFPSIRDPTMIRPAEPADTPSLVALGDATGVFQPGEADALLG